MAQDLTEDVLVKRLNVIIQLMLEGDGPVTTSGKIQRLLGMGLTQAEVADVLGKKPNYVGAVVATAKKAAARKRKESK